MSEVEYPTDVKLLLLQLVQESKQHTDWQDIIDRFTNHPILTRLHNLKNVTLNKDEVASLVSTIINSSLENERKLKRSVRRSRGRRPKDENIQNVSEAEINLEEAKDLSYFQVQNGVGRTLLVHVCTLLHHKRVDEIKNQLDMNKKQFASMLKEI